MKEVLLRLCGVSVAVLLAGSLAACQANIAPMPSISGAPVASVVPAEPPVDSTPQRTRSQAFEQALLNKTTFLYTDQTRTYFYQENVSFAQITAEDSSTMSPAQFAVVDMDGDGAPEVVYQRGDYRGFVILRYQAGDIYGYEVNYRGMTQLKKDGSCSASGGSEDTSFGKIRFLGNFFSLDEIAYSMPPYYIREQAVDREAFLTFYNEFEKLPDVDWRKYTEDSVKQWLERDLKLLETPAPVGHQSAEMQKYQDSLSCLLYFNYYPGSSATSADWELSSERYYDGWNNAMDAIYTLCMEKLSKEDIDALAAEQQQWLDARSQIAETDAFRTGDMTRLRTYDLISFYFGDQFYN